MNKSQGEISALNMSRYQFSHAYMDILLFLSQSFVKISFSLYSHWVKSKMFEPVMMLTNTVGKND